MKIHHISSAFLTVAQVKEIIEQNYQLALSEESKALIIKCRTYLEDKIASGKDELIYGINTGFGSLCKVKIDAKDLEQLQLNLMRSHACGTGDFVPPHIIRLMLLLKVQSLSYGHSGVKLETIERLVWLYNQNILPVVYTQGSLGASGDLCPLAHLCLPLIGEGEVWVDGERKNANILQEKFGIAPLKLGAKEGLALLNGTQFMAAYGVALIMEAEQLSFAADATAALSVDASFSRYEPFNEAIHRIRPHKGQVETAKNIQHILTGSEIGNLPKEHVQDPYSFRCVPQVHGASKDAIAYVKSVFETEINSVTDNPLVFPDEDLVLSGGNFHGQPLALALDHLCLALHELGSISERRTFQLLSGFRGLPEFLAAEPGLNSGLMIPQYTAAALVSENKQLCTPASADSITSSNGQEDHVSMGANAATKCYRISQNLKTILGIEWLTAAQALEFRRPLSTSPYLENLMARYRMEVSFISHDRYLHEDIEKCKAFITEISH